MHDLNRCVHGGLDPGTPRQAPVPHGAARGARSAVRVLKKSGNVFRVGFSLDFVRFHARRMGALNTCGEPNETELTIRVLAGYFTALCRGQVPKLAPLTQCRSSARLDSWVIERLRSQVSVGGVARAGSLVRVRGRSIPPPWGSIRFRPAPRTYDAPPWGPSVRA